MAIRRYKLTSLARLGYERLSKILADSAYGKNLTDWANKSFAFSLEVVKVSELAGFQQGRLAVVAIRWKVERTAMADRLCLDELVSPTKQRV